MLVTDNGANIVKAIKLLRQVDKDMDEHDANDDDSVASVAIGSDWEDDEDDGHEVELPVEDITFRRLGCMAHTLQFIIKKVYNNYCTVLEKARHLVGKIKSSVATEKLIARCSKTVISYNNTRWNSTFHMAKRLLDIKSAIAEVLSSINCDSPLVDDWSRLQEMTMLLEPFAVQTDVLQTGSHCRLSSHQLRIFSVI